MTSNGFKKRAVLWKAFLHGFSRKNYRIINDGSVTALGPYCIVEHALRDEYAITGL